MNATNKILTLILLMLIPLTAWAANSQDDGRSHFSVDQASVNIKGAGYDSDGLGTPFSFDGTGFLRMEFPTFCTITSVYTDDGLFYGIDWTSGGMGALTVVETDVPIIGNGTVGNPLGLDYGVGLSVVTGELVNTVTDTDTATFVISWDDVTALQVETIPVDFIPLVGNHCIAATSTANYIGVYISDWTPAEATDVLTIQLWVDGAYTGDYFTTNAGVAGAYGGTINEPLEQEQYCVLKAKITTANGLGDDIKIQTGTLSATF